MAATEEGERASPEPTIGECTVLGASASVQRTRTSSDNSRRPFRNCTWNECYANEHQLRDSNRSATKAESTRTRSVFRERCDRQQTLVIRITVITLARDSAITMARFRLSKIRAENLQCQVAQIKKFSCKCKFRQN